MPRDSRDACFVAVTPENLRRDVRAALAYQTEVFRIIRERFEADLAATRLRPFELGQFLT
jgi:hypothetical protein